MAFRRKDERGKLGLLPMVDIIFLLLIFFIVAHGVMTTEAQKRLVEKPADEFARELPPSSSSKPLNREAPELLIQIEKEERTNEEMFFLVRPGISLDQVRRLNPNGVPFNTVLNEIRRLGEQARESEMKQIIRIRPDKRTSYGTVMRIMSFCRGTETEPLIETVTFAVKMHVHKSFR